MRAERPLAAAIAVVLLTGCPVDRDPRARAEGPPSVPAAPPPPEPPLPDEPLARGEAILARVVRERCSDPAEPWAVAHRVLVEGAELRLPGGALAIEQIVARHLDPATLGFPRRGADGRPIEPHPGMIAKTLLEVGVPLERAFTLRDGSQARLAAIARAHLDAWTPGGEPELHDQAWLLEVAAGAADPRASALAERSLKVLARDQAYFERYAADPAKRYTKPFVRGDGGRPQPAEIHRYACGGFHLFQAVQRLHGGSAPSPLRRQHELLWVRLDRETAYWEEKLTEVGQRFPPPAAAQHRRVILTQLLKLQGHALETHLRAVGAGALPRAAAEVEQGFAALARTVSRLHDQGIYADLDAIRKSMPQIYLDLVGDSAHALHAYRLRR